MISFQNPGSSIWPGETSRDTVTCTPSTGILDASYQPATMIAASMTYVQIVDPMMASLFHRALPLSENNPSANAQHKKTYSPAETAVNAYIRLLVISHLHLVWHRPCVTVPAVGNKVLLKPLRTHISPNANITTSSHSYSRRCPKSRRI